MKSTRPQNQCRSRAFTLVEVICTIAILAVIGVLSSRLVLAAADQYLVAASRASIGAELSAAMERIATEVRQIPAKTGVSPTQADLGELTPSSMSWTDASATARAFSLSGSNLVVTEGANAFVLLSGVTAFSVQAYDESNTALPTTLAAGATGAVRRIEITITLARGGQSEALRSRFFLRCTVEGGVP